MKIGFLSAAIISGAFLSSVADAAVVTYSTVSSFTAATTGVSTVNFEGAPTGSSTYILAPANGAAYTQGGVTLTQTTNNAFLSDPTGPSVFYYYNWGTGDVINTPYTPTQSLTVTFAAPVTAFAVDLGTFYGISPIPAGTTPGAATTAYGLGLSIGTAQGAYAVNTATTRDFTFFGVTSDTAFSSFTITGTSGQAGASVVFDNVRFGSAAVAAAVPEPASWAMMVAGFGLIGGTMRRRRTNVAVA